MERNGLVSIFLRMLEYYLGILFMTTNRVHIFDDAFKSRIHVPLRYSELPPVSRERIWRHFMATAGDGSGDSIDDDGYAQLAEGRLNGRQIKNVGMPRCSHLQRCLRVSRKADDEGAIRGGGRMNQSNCYTWWE